MPRGKPLGSLAKAWASSFPAGHCCTPPPMHARMHACTDERVRVAWTKAHPLGWGGVSPGWAVRAHATYAGVAPHLHAPDNRGCPYPLHAGLKQMYQAVQVLGKAASQQASGAWWGGFGLGWSFCAGRDGDRGDARPTPPPPPPPPPPPFPAGSRGSSTPPLEPSSWVACWVRWRALSSLATVVCTPSYAGHQCVRCRLPRFRLEEGGRGGGGRVACAHGCAHPVGGQGGQQRPAACAGGAALGAGAGAAGRPAPLSVCTPGGLAATAPCPYVRGPSWGAAGFSSMRSRARAPLGSGSSSSALPAYGGGGAQAPGAGEAGQPAPLCVRTPSGRGQHQRPPARAGGALGAGATGRPFALERAHSRGARRQQRLARTCGGRLGGAAGHSGMRPRARALHWAMARGDRSTLPARAGAPCGRGRLMSGLHPWACAPLGGGAPQSPARTHYWGRPGGGAAGRHPWACAPL
jgi:hypothetical protein